MAQFTLKLKFCFLAFAFLILLLLMLFILHQTFALCVRMSHLQFHIFTTSDVLEWFTVYQIFIPLLLSDSKLTKQLGRGWRSWTMTKNEEWCILEEELDKTHRKQPERYLGLGNFVGWLKMVKAKECYWIDLNCQRTAQNGKRITISGVVQSILKCTIINWIDWMSYSNKKRTKRNWSSLVTRQERLPTT